jgi:hypothetical protein
MGSRGEELYSTAVNATTELPYRDLSCRGSDVIQRNEGWRAELCDLIRPITKTTTHRRLRARLLMLLVVTVAFDVAISVLVWLFAAGGNVTGILPAFAWTTSQLVVGGSSYQIETSVGHIAEVIAHVYGFTVLAAAAGSFATFFHLRHVERDAE